MKNAVRIITLAVTGLVAAAGSASGDIVVGSTASGTFSETFLGVQRFGQSFTATAQEPAAGAVSFRWWSGALTTLDPNITVRLRDGMGYGGAVLASHTQTVSRFLPDESWVDFVFPTAAALTAGHVYSLDFSLSNGASSGGAISALGDPYEGGVRLSNTGAPMSGLDLHFRVLTAPAPGSLGVLGLGALGLRRRR